jgi:enoyl-CoA hydratase/carnithine racemase
MSQPPANTVDDRAGVLHAVMRDPPRNALGESLIEALAAVVEEFEQGEAKVLVLSRLAWPCLVSASDGSRRRTAR